MSCTTEDKLFFKHNQVESSSMKKAELILPNFETINEGSEMSSPLSKALKLACDSMDPEKVKELKQTFKYLDEITDGMKSVDLLGSGSPKTFVNRFDTSISTDIKKDEINETSRPEIYKEDSTLDNKDTSISTDIEKDKINETSRPEICKEDSTLDDKNTPISTDVEKVEINETSSPEISNEDSTLDNKNEAIKYEQNLLFTEPALGRNDVNLEVEEGEISPEENTIPNNNVQDSIKIKNSYEAIHAEDGINQQKRNCKIDPSYQMRQVTGEKQTKKVSSSSNPEKSKNVMKRPCESENSRDTMNKRNRLDLEDNEEIIDKSYCRDLYRSHSKKIRRHKKDSCSGHSHDREYYDQQRLKRFLERQMSKPKWNNEQERKQHLSNNRIEYYSSKSSPSTMELSPKEKLNSQSRDPMISKLDALISAANSLPTMILLQLVLPKLDDFHLRNKDDRRALEFAFQTIERKLKSTNF